MKGKWIGIIDGTNKGQCVLDLQEKDGKTQGVFSIHDIKYQNLRYLKVSADFNSYTAPRTTCTFMVQGFAQVRGRPVFSPIL